MFADGSKKTSSAGSMLDRERSSGNGRTSNAATKTDNLSQSQSADEQNASEHQQFLSSSKKSKTTTTTATATTKTDKKKSKRVRLAREESFGDRKESEKSSFLSMALGFACKRKWVLLMLMAVCCIAAIYCIPYVDIQVQIPPALPYIPFNFRDGPLRESSPSQFKAEHLFKDTIFGPESVAIDAAGNMYMAIEGGFILYAQVNPPARRESLTDFSVRDETGQDLSSNSIYPKTSLIKIAELNAIKFMGHERRGTGQSAWRRECQLDEKVYGPLVQYPTDSDHNFTSNVRLSRCSKPLGLRLSNNESFLYVVDSLTGLYKVNLKVPERPNSSQRQVTKLIDFRPNRKQLLPVFQSDQAVSPSRPSDLGLEADEVNQRPRLYMNISLMAIDDLSIDHGAGTNGGDIIYLSDASQTWPALSVFYDMLEGRPNGVILRYDTGLNHLSVLSPSQVARVRTSIVELNDTSSRLYTNGSAKEPHHGIGAPQLNADDVFDDRPLHFPNGLELTDDKEALLIADTLNKRIIKHYIRGPRVGTSDLWAWTPNFPDNIRRGFSKDEETYWVVGCGEDTSNKMNLLADLRGWPRVRKMILKSIYLVGWLVESVGSSWFGSQSILDFGYSVKIGSSVCQSFCPGMMILQYNRFGDIIRSIHSHEFPSDLQYYSQVNEVIDTVNNQHILYLSSPSYSYVTKLILPPASR